MNWIFEVYGDTYSSMLFQKSRPVATHNEERKAEFPRPAFTVMGFLGRARGNKAAT